MKLRAQNYHPFYFCHQRKSPLYIVSHSHGALQRVKVEFIKKKKKKSGTFVPECTKEWSLNYQLDS